MVHHHVAQDESSAAEDADARPEGHLRPAVQDLDVPELGAPDLRPYRQDPDPASPRELGLAPPLRPDTFDDEVLVHGSVADARAPDDEPCTGLGRIDGRLERCVAPAAVSVRHPARRARGPRCRANLQRQDEDKDEGCCNQCSDAAPHAGPDGHRMALLIEVAVVGRVAVDVAAGAAGDADEGAPRVIDAATADAVDACHASRRCGR